MYILERLELNIYFVHKLRLRILCVGNSLVGFLSEVSLSINWTLLVLHGTALGHKAIGTFISSARHLHVLGK